MRRARTFAARRKAKVTYLALWAIVGGALTGWAILLLAD